MGYKIRNKSIFWTRGGWKNNWHPKNFNTPRPSDGEMTVAIRCRYDHHSFLRMHQTYRNMSRHCKQYFLGDKQLEEIFILGLRSFFYIPYDSQTPTDLIKHGGERRFVDQYDRDFELMSYNQHPYQLFTYQVRNEHLEWKNQQYQQIQKGENTYEQEILNHLDNLINTERSNLRDGQRLSIERMTEIVLQVFRQARAGQTRPAQDSRGPDGNINDYLEQRRPFAHPNISGVTH
ncbi:hypothetical protein IMG5_054710 [Ichthyophthirius multifiliis]|uniref:Uncharacterized protein n=1 Tax=Ichthyophthirius multifiliis TaxID=5932 RepID=G0QN18_ICHMU|nr:hypothetical protein IMG5_054710 [Ichthyophthirius multifiliis]EGR33381.1 hypothetical protein IMG5_054710 [Ichthyophthirius multifiliis]|eukprot:XP_004037367.1 hypothetical protein IMG5_054710 [Ichthyophthirius multifiliis]